MANIEDIISAAKITCLKRRVNLTSKREVILRAIVGSNIPLSAYEIIDICRIEHDLIITPMSIYRMLNVLEEHHLIHRLKSANKYIACIHMNCGHDHKFPQFLICKVCGNVKEFDIEESTIESLKKSILSAGFKSNEMQLELESICNACHEKHDDIHDENKV
ncbi:Fur family transcriptional regulator [Thorsellia kenyensis]|uniref:Fur family transcriptional regulator n=1 Tax=Thorsellia kenyensis TaxID=1549888 RepID=A0ABV6C7Y3_9GAMM